ncbi:unnamed protein product [Lactuca saligna]|uniref:Protein FAR1-RELATED SEQUENCE n=1 Tax=Lactuca saligna TaxID=75948 RepID=A0AA36A3U6_LACSI|nr:unnamed protein product [Lactuca saligna]
MDVHTGNWNQENEDQNPGKDLGNINDPKNLDANHAEDENHFFDEDTEVNIDFSEGQPHVRHYYVSPGGTLYWTPIVSDDIKPKVSSKFNSYGEVETMYRNYALESGFDVRLGRVQKTKNEIITNRHLVGPSFRGGLVYDFKNARRNLNCCIGRRDAKFLVDKMNDRKKNVPSFTFKYKVLNKRLDGLFWADETAKYNYNSFGDVVSLDATFSMNKYF